MHFDGSRWYYPSCAAYRWTAQYLAGAIAEQPLTEQALGTFIEQEVGEVFFGSTYPLIALRSPSDVYDIRKVNLAENRFRPHGFYDFALPHDEKGPSNLALLCTKAFYRVASERFAHDEELQRIIAAEAHRFYEEHKPLVNEIYDEFHEQWVCPVLWKTPDFLQREFQDVRASYLRKNWELITTTPEGMMARHVQMHNPVMPPGHDPGHYHTSLSKMR
jgi:hypothetical protein